MNPIQVIKLITKIHAPIEKVFDLSRSIDLHVQSMEKTKEIAIGGRTSGLINKDETVTWEGKHFGFYLRHTSLISEMKSNEFFEDVMLKGHFKSYRHEHHFKSSDNGTLMIDYIYYETPYGFFGKLFDVLFLNKHLTNLIHTRNITIKTQAEAR